MARQAVGSGANAGAVLSTPYHTRRYRVRVRVRPVMRLFCFSPQRVRASRQSHPLHVKIVHFTRLPGSALETPLGE